jgi:hypothetical protein
MAKASCPGWTKTRLVPPLTFEEAAAFNTAFLQDVAANIAVADRDARRWGGRLSGYMAFGPPRSEPFFREILPVSVGLIEAWHPNFGDCLFAAVKKLLVLGHSGAVVLNSDSPTLPTALLVEAAEVLALRRSRRSRPLDRRRLLPARSQEAPPAAIRGCGVEHRVRCASDARPRSRDRSGRTRAAVLVRRGRLCGATPLAIRTVCGRFVHTRTYDPSSDACAATLRRTPSRNGSCAAPGGRGA